MNVPIAVLCQGVAKFFVCIFGAFFRRNFVKHCMKTLPIFQFTVGIVVFFQIVVNEIGVNCFPRELFDRGSVNKDFKNFTVYHEDDSYQFCYITIKDESFFTDFASYILDFDMIKKHGGKKIKFMCLIAAPEGLEKLENAHPDIQIYVGNIDRELNENAYICPGLGDAGDRIFGTK